MRTWLPWILVAVSVLLIVAMPWRRPDPHHVFIFGLVANLDENIAEPVNHSTVEVQQLGHRTAAGSTDHSSGPHL